MKDLISSPPENLAEALRRSAKDYPNRGIGIYDGRGRHCDYRSYAELERAAQNFAGRFDAMGIGAREPVLVALPTSWDWLECWFGLLLRGAWPVASSAAGAMAAAEVQLSKVETVMEAIGSQFVVAGSAFARQAQEQGCSYAKNGILTTEALAATVPTPGFITPVAQADDIAFLQLTSGSTGVPRAVMITHRGTIHNNLASNEAIGYPLGAPAHEWADAMVSWLPLYHDMGLIGSLMLSMLTGLNLWLFRPPTFLAFPQLWLQSLGSKGATFCASPNFGYQLCVERVSDEKKVGLDLSNWKAAMCGAEMIRRESFEGFCNAFAGHGFEPTAFRPCYGLAEATLAVTFDIRGEGLRTLPAPMDTDAGFGMTDVVSNGVPIRDTEVRIIGPNRQPLPEDEIGEVDIRGPGIFAGYYNDPVATDEQLRNGWFATGDLGFLHNSELYLTGRTKDLLIVHGQNLMPDEIERIADGVTGGGGLVRSAAFSVVRGSAGEEAVVVVESETRDSEKLAPLAREIRVRVGRLLGLPLADLVFVRRGRIPRTTSGKLQRGEVRKQYLDGTLENLTGEK